MSTMPAELNRVTRVLVMRGVLLLILAMVAMVWPERALFNALLGVGSVCIVYGIYEIMIALGMKAREPQYWWLPLTDGGASCAFGLITVATMVVEFSMAVMMISAWFLAYGVCLWSTAVLLARRPVLRRTLVTLGYVHVAFAIAVFVSQSHPRLSMLALPTLGAAYAAAFGLLQVAGGLWLQRSVRYEVAREVAQPVAAPL